jgi:hypothetical protein
MKWSALLLIVVQAALLFVAPVSACCRDRSTRQAQTIGAADEDCCPAGSHPPGQCPLHKGKTKSSGSGGSRECRLRCAASQAPDFTLGAIGVLPGPAAIPVAAPRSTFGSIASSTVLARSLNPDAPPPKAL